MDPTFSSSAEGGLNNSSSNLSFNITTTVSNGTVVLSAFVEKISGSGSPSISATLAGNAMTRVDQSIGSGVVAGFFVITGVSAGTHAIVVSRSEGGNAYTYGVAACYEGVDQSTPVDAASAIDQNSSTNQSVSVDTVTAGSLVLGMFASLEGGTTATATSPNVVREQFGSDGYCAILDHGSATAVPGSVSVAWTFGSAKAPRRMAMALRSATPPPPPGPEVDTLAVDDIGTTTATANGEITDVGSEDCDERGFVYGTSSEADPGDTAPDDSDYTNYTLESGTFSEGVFDAALSSLTPDTTYYVRAWAHNSDGYSYGDEVSFSTDALIYGIGGVVTLNGVGVEAATVRCIKQSDNTTIAAETTDATGAYEFLDLEDGELYHLAVEYEADDLKYYAPSYWDIVPVVTN